MAITRSQGLLARSLLELDGSTGLHPFFSQSLINHFWGLFVEAVHGIVLKLCT